MLKLKKIAITGGLAAGKTTICRIFKELGAYVISADEIVHQLLSPKTEIGQQVIRLLGTDVVSGEEFDRKKIAAKVFPRPDLLHSLEEILHPAVFDEIEKKHKQIAREKKYSLFVAEIPLLFEAKREKDFDAVIAVVADPEIARQRYTQQEYEQRMIRQIEPKLKASKADYTIENNGSLDQLKNQIKNLYSQLTESDF